ncbi:MAG: M14 family metallopeptidase, partial [Deltaproteobacteria bacterium]|nr:M14 family metallopeptidase [Nannocystaceae bacterium]
MAFIAALAARGDRRLHVGSFGVSPQGRELPLLVLSEAGVRTPAQARALGRPVVLMLDGIHPGEVEGKEASLAFVRDLLDGKHDDLLAQLTLLVVPLFNPDGNDALDPANRRLDLAKLTGQPGPLVGTRTQSHGINLNRDYLRQAAPEMRQLQQHVCIPWAPDLTIDNHATNGSVHRFDMTVDVPHTVASGRAEPIEFMRQRVIPEVMRAVKARGFESGWYGNFVEDERCLDAGDDADPHARVGEGWMTYPHHPRFGSSYRGLTNRLDVLLECYSYISFERRVQTASAWQIELLRWVATHPGDVLQVVAASARPPEQVAVRYRLEAFSQPIEILTRTPRTLEGEPCSVHIPHLARFVGSTMIQRPPAYVVPPTLAEHLRAHGLHVEAANGVLDCAVARVESIGSEQGRGILEAA